jgi:glycosyltransferase involved in cell wall biosynthesis
MPVWSCVELGHMPHSFESSKGKGNKNPPRTKSTNTVESRVADISRKGQALNQLATATIGFEFTSLDRHRPRGGQFKYVMDLVRGASIRAPSSTRFVFIGSLPQPPEEIADLFRDRPRTWKYLQMAPWNFRGGRYLQHIRFSILALRENLSLLHCPHAFVPAWVPCPVILTVHDLIFEIFDEYRPVLKDRFYKLNRWLNIHRTDRYISISDSTTQDMVRLWNSDPARINTIHHGHHPWPKTDPCPEAFQWLGDNPEQTILSTFNLEPRKNLHAMLEAFALLAPRYPKLKLILFGSAECTPERERRYKEHVAHLGIGERVVRTGFVSERTLATLYSRVSMFVFPSIYEGFGYPALEAMSAGACVVCGRLSSLPEIVGDAGLLVEILLNNPERRRRLGEAGTARAASFSVEKMVLKTLNFYETTLSQ